MTKGIVYYTTNQLDPIIATICQEKLKECGISNITSVSLKPMKFGLNIYLKSKPGYLTMIKQILYGLKVSTAEVVYLAEHDVLYHPSHFEFDPPERNKFYYNVNVWRWDYPNDRAITYEYIVSQSGLCAYREFLLEHYSKRVELIEKRGWDNGAGGDPRYARVIGYEPGSKTLRQGGISDDRRELWLSPYPNIDIRHRDTFTLRKVLLTSFKHKPDKNTWKESTINAIPGWYGIRERFI